MVISYYEFDTEWECNHEDKWCDLRQLTSKESWLWQFVCENGMVYYNDESIYSPTEFRIIESALTDESELEDFLLSNIKIEWKV